jgi:cysteine desulfurase/selenocysteine lyase
MTTPEAQPFTPELIARIANELFQTGMPGGEAGPVGTPVDTGPAAAVEFDAVEHAVENPATTADISSTSLAPAPGLGAMQAYNLSAVDLNAMDESGYRQALDSLDLGLVDTGSHLEHRMEEVAGPVAPAAPTVTAPDADQPVGAVEPPAVGEDAGEIPDSQSVAHVLQETPTDLTGVLESVAGDHPYLQGQYDAVLQGAQVDDAGAGTEALQLLKELAEVAREFTGEHAVAQPDLGEGSDAYHHGARAATTESADQPVAGAESEAGYLQDHLDQLGTAALAAPADDELQVSSDEGYQPTLSPVDVPDPGIPATTTGFDAERVRADFPILSERINGRRLVWLDNGATTQKPRQVIDRLSYFYEHENSNVHRTAHTLAGRATDAYEGARDKVRAFINAPSADDIVWVRGTTEGINLVADTYGEQEVCEGDEVLISHLEHHANIVPWQMLCQRKGATLRVAPVDDTGQIILSEYERLITPRTRIIAFTHVSNALGTITPAKEMIEIAHRHGVPVLVDGAQGVLHMPVDVQDLDCDFYVFSGHKLFAPTGIGVVFGKQEYLQKMPPWQGGGNMIDRVAFDHTTFQAPPWRFEAGTGSIADAVGLGAAIDYLERVGMAHVEAAEQELLAYGTEQLRTVPGLCIYGTAAHKAGVLSFNVTGHDPVAVGAYLDQEGIAVRAGHHCAQPILRRFGVEATVRAALALYNTKEDIDRLVDALGRMLTGTPGIG